MNFLSRTAALTSSGTQHQSAFRTSSDATTAAATADFREIINLREDLQAVKDEAAASKEVIAVLRKQVEELQKEKETLTALHQDNFDDEHLLEILRTKDAQVCVFTTAFYAFHATFFLLACRIGELITR